MQHRAREAGTGSGGKSGSLSRNLTINLMKEVLYVPSFSSSENGDGAFSSLITSNNSW